MKSFQRKKGWRDIVQSKPVLFLLAMLVLFFAWGVVGFMGKMQLTIENRKIAEDRLKELQDKKIKLSSDISKLNTEQGIEENIRLKFGLAKEGEGVIVVVPDQDKEEVKEEKPSGFFSFIKSWFQ